MTAPILILLATFYSSTYNGKIMANGAKYNPSAYTVAINRLPLGTHIIICNRMSWRCARATVTDRMRFDNRVDMSPALFKYLKHGQYVLQAEVYVDTGTHLTTSWRVKRAARLTCGYVGEDRTSANYQMDDHTLGHCTSGAVRVMTHNRDVVTFMSDGRPCAASYPVFTGWMEATIARHQSNITNVTCAGALVLDAANGTVPISYLRTGPDAHQHTLQTERNSVSHYSVLGAVAMSLDWEHIHGAADTVAYTSCSMSEPDYCVTSRAAGGSLVDSHVIDHTTGPPPVIVSKPDTNHIPGTPGPYHPSLKLPSLPRVK